MAKQRKRTYQGRVQVRGIRKSKDGFPTKTAAERWENETRLAIEKGQTGATSKEKVGEAMEEIFRLMRERNSRAGGTLYNLEGDYRRYIKPRFANRRTSAVEKNDVQDLVDDLEAKGLSRGTIENILKPLKLLYGRLEERGELDRPNPMVGKLRLPKGSTPKTRVFNPEEGRRMLDAIPNLKDRVIYGTMMFTGIRIGEAQALKIEEIDLDARIVEVNHNWSRTPGARGLGPTKSRKKREVPIPQILYDYLFEYMSQLEWDEGFVFGETATVPFVYGSVRKRVYEALEAAGMWRVKPHACRHSHATIRIDGGDNPANVAAELGHASTKMTIDTYTHPTPGHLEKSAKRLDTYFGDAVSTLTIQLHPEENEALGQWALSRGETSAGLVAALIRYALDQASPQPRLERGRGDK
jgi:integrase